MTCQDHISQNVYVFISNIANQTNFLHATHAMVKLALVTDMYCTCRLVGLFIYI